MQLDKRKTKRDRKIEKHGIIPLLYDITWK